MKKFFILFIGIILFGMLTPVSAETLNYKIRQEGNSMVIVPYYSIPPTMTSPERIPNVETAPVKIPFYSEKNLPKGKNRTRQV